MTEPRESPSSTEPTVEALHAEVARLRAELARQRAAQQTAMELREEALKAQAAQGASEEKYRTLFESVDDGFCIIEVLFDANDQPFDYRFLEVNPAFERQTGLTEAIGRTILEFHPGHEKFWYEVYGRVSRTGESLRFENNAEALGRYYDVNAFRVGAPGENQVAVLFRDVTERKRRESNAALLDTISKDLARMTTADEIMQTIGARVGEHLGLSGCVCVDVEETTDEVTVHHGWVADQVPSLKQTFRLSDYYPTEEFARACRAGETFVVNDTSHDPRTDAKNYARLKLGAFVTIPFLRNGVWTHYFAITNEKTREWRQDEIELLEEITQRLFPRIERARTEEALRDSEERYRTLFNSTDQALGLIELIYDADGKPADIRYLETNPTFRRMVGFDGSGKTVSETLGEIDHSRYEWYDRILKTGEPARIEYSHERIGAWFTIFAARVGGGGSRRAIVIFDDITERKRREQRQGFLLKLSDALRPLSGSLEIQQAVMRVVGETLQVDRVLYADVLADDNTVVIADNHVSGDFPKMTGTYRADDFGVAAIDKLRAGETLVVEDVESTTKLTEEAKAAYLSINTQAQLVVPLRKGGRWVSNLAVHHGKPRQWTVDDVGILQEAAERTWAAVERARAEEALRASEERLNAVANVAPDLLWRSEADGTTAWYNDRWIEYTGQTMEQSIGWGWVNALHPDERAGAAEKYRKSVAAGESIEQEQRLRRADGEYRWHLIRAKPLHDAGGRVVRMYGAATDIHDLRQAAEAQRISEERLRVALETAEMAAWDYDVVANQVVWNDQHFQLLGLPVMDGPMAPEDFLREVHPEDDARIRECLRIAVEETGQYRADFRIIRADTGEERWMSGFGQATKRTSNGRAARMAGVMVDITERKLAETALRAAKDEAEAASRAKDDFLAALSHELRNPLNPVLLSASDLAHDPSLPEAVRGQLKMIHRNIELEARLIDDLLDLTRITQGKMRLQLMPNDVHALLRHTEEIVREDAAAAGVELEFILEAEESQVLADAARLQQVFWNLIKNGIKFSGNRGGMGTGKVRVRTFNATPGCLTLHVQDNGVGISPAMMAKIFRPFEQGEHGGHRFGGLGLGLTIAKKVVDLHEGELRAESAGLGQGSTFTVELAIVATSTINYVRSQTPASAIRPLRLLVVEDHEPTIQVLSRVLQRDGHEVHMARTAAEALMFAEKGECDLVISDIGLPDHTGIEMMRDLRRLRGWRGIALSGYGMETDIRGSLEAGFVAHLVKPLNIDSVRKAIRDAMATQK